MSEKIATREAYGKALAELGNVNDNWEGTSDGKIHS